MLPISIETWPLVWVIVAFAVAAAIIAVAGTYLARVADRLADLTGMGEAIFGALMLGGATSLPGIVTSVTVAYDGYAQLAVSNAIGGIAAQTVFLAVADTVYRGVNLEHAAASVTNLTQGALLLSLLSLPILAHSGPEWHWLGIHPISVILIVAYGFGLHLSAQVRDKAPWKPKRTGDTKQDKPEDLSGKDADLKRQWVAFVLSALVVAVAGYVIARTGISIAERTGLSETVVGGLFTAIATSLPELITAVAAVRQGALTLAVGDIIGGNAFDVLFVAFADVAYRQGSIYHQLTGEQLFVLALALLMTAVLMLGLLRRERRGIANVGFETLLLVAIYVGGFSVVVMGF